MKTKCCVHLPGIFIVFSSVDRDDRLLRDSTFADWADQNFRRLAQPLKNAWPTVQMTTFGNYGFLGCVQANVALIDRCERICCGRLWSRIFFFF